MYIENRSSAPQRHIKHLYAYFNFEKKTKIFRDYESIRSYDAWLKEKQPAGIMVKYLDALFYFVRIYYLLRNSADKDPIPKSLVFEKNNS